MSNQFCFFFVIFALFFVVFVTETFLSALSDAVESSRGNEVRAAFYPA